MRARPRTATPCDIDFEGFVDGVAFDGGKAEHYSLVLGCGSFIPGFEEQVVGHKAGEEFDVNVKFPEEYQAEELAGKDATFKIKLHEVKYKRAARAGRRVRQGRQRVRHSGRAEGLYPQGHAGADHDKAG